MKAGEKFFLVTPKGVEELRGRAHKLDAGAKNILSLIEQGSTNPDAILQRSKAPRETVIDGLRWLMSHGFVATGTSDGTPSPGAHDAASVTSSISERLRLKPGISPAQARFLLTDFCLDQFGADGQVLAECGRIVHRRHQPADGARQHSNRGQKTRSGGTGGTGRLRARNQRDRLLSRARRRPTT